MKNTATNDNDPSSFIALQAATRNVIQYLQGDKQKNEEGERDTDAREREKQSKEYQRAYIEQRLRELAIWERRINGK